MRRKTRQESGRGLGRRCWMCWDPMAPGLWGLWGEGSPSLAQFTATVILGDSALDTCKVLQEHWVSESCGDSSAGGHWDWCLGVKAVGPWAGCPQVQPALPKAPVGANVSPLHWRREPAPTSSCLGSAQHSLPFWDGSFCCLVVTLGFTLVIPNFHRFKPENDGLS